MKTIVRYHFFTVLLLLLAFFTTAAISAEKPKLHPGETMTTPQTLQRAGDLMVSRGAQFDQALNKAVDGAVLQHRMQAQMQTVARPENMIPSFMKYFRQNPQARSGSSLQKSLSPSSLPTGNISGAVTIDGSAPDPSYEILVIAFDQHGYYMGHDENVASHEGFYQIRELPVGEYYVLTLSNRYVDEIYNNLVSPVDSPQTWRQAEMVQVVENATTTDIHFDLQRGAVLTGFITGEDGYTPIQDMDITFIVTGADAEKERYSTIYYTIDGFYDLVVPLMGDIKVAAVVEGYLPQWYNSQMEWAAATPLTITKFDTVISGIDYFLQTDPSKAFLGGISGSYRYSDQFVPPIASFATVFFFHASDTTLANWTLGIGGSYTLEQELEPGEYYVYLDDQLGNLLGLSNYMGQYWENANTPDGAKTVTVNAGEVTYGIDFVLEKGGVLSGDILAEDGKKLDGVWVLAVDATLVSGELQPFFDNLHVFIGSSDSLGHYRIEGMPSGHYLIRTISDSLINSDLGMMKLTSGKYSGKVVDRWYGGDADLFSIDTATPVLVNAPQESPGVDIILEKAKYISGRIFDSITSQGTSFYRLFALNDTSGVPFISFSMFTTKKDQIDPLGFFNVGPLPSGSYKLLAVAPLSGPNNYLSEFYDGAYAFDAAQTVTVNDVNVTDLNIAVEKAAMIQGFIDLPMPGGSMRAGTDVLDNFPILVYEATTGKLASMDYVQFNGGYRVDHLLPGQYKVLALPCVPQVAATYFGGGNTWDDPASQIITVGYGDVADCDILLDPALNTISGTVVDDESGDGLTQVMVIAYEPSGHPVGLAMSNYDMVSGTVVDMGGGFTIPGLRPGAYYLRTFALSSAFGLSDQLLSVVDMVGGGGTDVLGGLLGGELGGFTALFDLEFGLYADQWHHNIAAPMVLDFQTFLVNLLAYGLPSSYDNSILPIFLPLPMGEIIPEGVSVVNVTEGSAVTGVEFRLHKISLDDVTGVDVNKNQIPDQFTVYPNYPNPFNPATTLTFAAPEAGQVRVVIYDALGRQVREMVNGFMPAGTHALQWDGRSDGGEMAASGVYLARFSTNGAQKTIKMVFMK